MNIKVAYKKLAIMEQEKEELISIIDTIKRNTLLTIETRKELEKSIYHVHDKLMDKQEELEEVLYKVTKGITIIEEESSYIVERK